MRTDEFFRYAATRERIRLLKEAGSPAPFTTDPILATYRFCNVFREDDKVTRWFAENIRNPLKHKLYDVFLATVAFRWFNLPATGEAMKPFLLNGNWDADKVAAAIYAARGDGPYTTGAYMIKSKIGMKKVEGLCWCIDQIDQEAAHWHEFLTLSHLSMEELWVELTRFPYMGPFMAYEVVTDLRYTAVLQDAPDKLSWANPGPGAARGLCRLLGLPLKALDRNKEKDRGRMIGLMQELLQASRDPFYWPWTDRPWELREVEHTLCEFDKYERVRTGEGRPKQHYVPS